MKELAFSKHITKAEIVQVIVGQLGIDQLHEDYIEPRQLV
jgi:hypothetical protein